MSRNAVIEVRCDIRHLATIARFFQKKGQVPVSKSELGGNAFELLSQIIENQGAEPVESVAAAMNILDRLGLGVKTKKSMLKLAKELQADSEMGKVDNSLNAMSVDIVAEIAKAMDDEC